MACRDSPYSPCAFPPGRCVCFSGCVLLRVGSKKPGRRVWLRRPGFFKIMAEREGFEPPVLLPVQRFSRPPHSTTLASLQQGDL